MNITQLIQAKTLKHKKKKTKIKKLGVEIGLFFTYNIYSI